MATLIEQDAVQGAYSTRQRAIVITDDGHRIFITEGYGGVDSLAGGAERWRHGYAVQVKDDDTMETMRNDVDWPMLQHHGEDDGRYILDFDGVVIESIAESVGL